MCFQGNIRNKKNDKPRGGQGQSASGKMKGKSGRSGNNKAKNKNGNWDPMGRHRWGRIVGRVRHAFLLTLPKHGCIGNTW